MNSILSSRRTFLKTTAAAAAAMCAPAVIAANPKGKIGVARIGVRGAP